MFKRLFGVKLDAQGKKVQVWMRKYFGHSPKDASIVRQALRHSSSVAKEERGARSNERLEFLGDAVLSAVVADLLYQQYPDRGEGFLTRMRSQLVSRQTLNKLALRLEIDTVLESNIPTDRTSAVYGNALEAVIGAMYLDRGYAKTCGQVEQAILKHFDLQELEKKGRDDKSQLLEWGQKHRRKVEFLTQEGKSNGRERSFRSLVQVNGEPKGKGSGRSKKKAEQEAARKTLKMVRGRK